MTTRSGPGGGRPDPGLGAIMSERRQLINLAYRLLGSLAEAEDAVQETYARWYAMSRPEQEAIESPGAWLTTVASRICLNLLGSARARRERYVGEWIPEPLPDRLTGRPDGTVDPADRVTLDESVSMAFLGQASPSCRAGTRNSDRPARRDRPRLQTGLAGQGNQRSHRPARPRRHGDRRRRWPRPDLPAPHRRRRADRARLGRTRQPGDEQHDAPRAHGQRPARHGRSGRRRHRDGVRVRRHRRPDQTHLGSTQPRETPALDHELTRAPDQDRSVVSTTSYESC